MKKAKLFMMLALLVMGVSNTMGATKTKDYFVNYETEFLTGTGYNIDASQSDLITSIVKFENLKSTLGNKIEQVGDRMIRVTYDDSYRWNGYSLQWLANNDYSNIVNYVLAGELKKCITAKGPSESNYTSKVWIYTGSDDSYDGGNTVYITYQYTGQVTDDDTWTEGEFTYSTIYTKTNSRNIKNRIKLPAGQCAVSLNDYTKTSVTIPKEDSNGNKVVALQTLAMCQEGVKHRIDYKNCYINNDGSVGGTSYNSANDTDSDAGMVNWSSNGTLQEVAFDKPSNIRSIGDYAFESCYKLTTIEIPQSVEYLGEGTFSQCLGITDGLTFERTSGASFTTNLEVIRNFTFWNCQNMTDLELPDGIIVIEGQQSGSSMQYLMGLTKLRLPNTVVAIGPHFLCDASSLESVSIPASVRYIDGACFHGCEGLQEVFLMGPASALQGVYDGSDTFGANKTNCKSHVSQCVFITTQQNIGGYATDPNGVWQLIGDNKQSNCSTKLRAVKTNEDGDVVRDSKGNPVYLKDDNGEYVYLTYANSTSTNPNYVETKVNNSAVCSEGWNNALTYLPDQKVTFTPDKWMTVIFPKAFTQDELKASFGNDVVLAKMTGFVKPGPDFSYVNGKRTYHLNFTAQTDAKAHVPYMIKPGHIKASTDAKYNSPYDVALIAANEMNEEYRIERDKDHALMIEASDNSEVVMYGWYKKREMKQWEFYFMNPYDEKTKQWNQHCVFKRIVDPAQAPTIKAFRCYWRIWLEGEAQDAGAGAKSVFFRFADDNETTGIEEVESKIGIEFGIYDLNGRKLDLKKEDLPKGLFIINGKKVMVK